jgi:phosphoglycolate phosphatase-like HAD superfamily hydrolase
MSDWMRRLAGHYAAIRAAHPHDRLVVVFDIDGTILDMRHMVCRLLVAYDHAHGTHHFRALRPGDVDVHENDVATFLERRGLPAPDRARILSWYLHHRWQPDAVRHAHAAYPDVMAVIRWFQIQPCTTVALNTGRPESLREATLASLETLGQAHRVRFAPELVHMNAGGWDADVAVGKVAALRAIEAAGYRTVAVIDNEPEVIAAMAAGRPRGEVLCLHARTVFESRRPLPPGAAAGHRYDLRTLIGEDDLPDHVELVWHGVNDHANLRHFLASPVRWGEGDVRRDPQGRLALRHDPFGEPSGDAPDAPDHPLLAEELLGAARSAGKAVKLDIKEPEILGELLRLVDRTGIAPRDLWFNGRVDVLGPAGLRRLRRAHPDAVVQVPVDALAPLVLAAPSRARARLVELATWGVDRFSLAWDTARSAALLDRFDQWGFAVNLYAVEGLDDFLRAVVLLPRSVTADFNFPEWHYFGRGAGHGGRHHRYHLDPAPPATDVA